MGKFKEKKGKKKGKIGKKIKGSGKNNVEIWGKKGGNWKKNMEKFQK